jgi:hypothetical protein
VWIRIIAVGDRELDRNYSPRDWSFLLHIAAEYGWEPAGPVDTTESGSDLDQYCPADDVLRQEFDADPAIRGHFRTFENFRYWRRVIGAKMQLYDRLKSYGDGNGQHVTPDDARNLSLALSRALDDNLSVLPRLALRHRYFDKGDSLPGLGLSEVGNMSEEELGWRVMRAVGFPSDKEIAHLKRTKQVAALKDTAAKGGFYISKGLGNVRVPLSSPSRRHKHKRALN